MSHITAVRDLSYFVAANGNDNKNDPPAAAEVATLETLEPALDLDLFEVQFLETGNNSSTCTGSGSGAGSEHIEQIDHFEPVVVASTSTMNDLGLSSNADAEEKSALSTVATLRPHYLGSMSSDLASFVVGAVILFCAPWVGLRQ